MNRNVTVNEVLNVSLNLITSKIKQILDIIDSLNIESNLQNISELIELKKYLSSSEKDIINVYKNKTISIEKLTRFSLVVYHIINSIFEYTNSCAKNEVFKLNSEHIKKFKSRIKALRVCINGMNS